MVAAPEDPTVLPAPPPRWASIEDDENLPEFMMSLEREEEVVVATQMWPATRGPSLDEFAGIHMFSDIESLTAAQVASAEANEVFSCSLNVQSPRVVPEMLTQWTAMDEFMKAKSSMHKESFSSDASTAVSMDEDQATPPSGLSDDEDEALKDTSATLKISLTDTLGLWSIGSASHETGTCKPCAFLWKDLKKPGCQNGRECVFCHLCPPGEVKRRKKQKMFMRKVSKNLQYMEQFEPQCEPQYMENLQYMGFEPQCKPQYQNQISAGYGVW